MDDFTKFYSPEVLKHASHPRNMGRISNADAEAIMGNPVCGDVMKFYLKIGKRNKEDYIKDVKFQTLGCGAAIATASILTTLAKGKNLSEVKKITKNNIIKALGGLPPAKIHCSLLADEVLKKAIKNYYNNLKVDMSSKYVIKSKK
jgi:nitrogen fixation protein NifU and related proteins